MQHSAHRRSRFRALVAAACTAVLGAGLLAGAGAATTTDAAAPSGRVAAGSKVLGYFTE